MYITGRFQRPKPLLLGIYIGMAEAAPDTRLAFLRKASAPQTQGPSTALADSRANRPAALGMTIVVVLGPHAAGVAVTAVGGADVAQVHRVFERYPRNGGGLGAAFLLGEDGVADGAILADHLSVGAHVLAVVAAEAAGKVEVADIVGVSLPVNLHFREGRGAIDALQLGDGVA